jgi:hypothetical protein
MMGYGALDHFDNKTFLHMRCLMLNVDENVSVTVSLVK